MRWYWILLLIIAGYIVFGFMMRTAYENGMNTGENSAMEQCYVHMNICKEEIGNAQAACSLKVKGIIQNSNS